MAKRNLFLGTASGKIGDIVVYRAGGTQRSRVRVIPKDAKTKDQMVQRSRIAAVVANYRAGKGLFMDSFESRESKQTPYNAFAAEALPTAPYITKELADVNTCVPMPMQFSHGSLPNPFYGMSIQANKLEVQVQVGEGYTIATVGALSQALIAARPCCFKEGSQILFPIFNFAETGPAFVQIEKFVLDTSSATSLSALGNILAEVENGIVTFTITPDDDTMFEGTALVVNKDAEGIHVTTSAGVMNSGASTKYQSYLTDSAKAAAAESYGASGGSCVI